MQIELSHNPISLNALIKCGDSYLDRFVSLMLFDVSMGFYSRYTRYNRHPFKISSRATSLEIPTDQSLIFISRSRRIYNW